MESSKKKKPDYRALEQKIFVKITLLMVTALIVVFLLQSLARGEAGNFTVRIIQDVFDVSQHRALILYNRIIRANLGYILTGSVAVFFIILSRFMLSQFSKYFMEISNGLDVLVGDKSNDIKLPSEMETMERKLKTIKQTLEDREREARQLEQRKNDLVMYLAHDIKTPLTSVIGYLSLLDEVPDMPAEQKTKYIHIGLEKACRLENLINEFFEITRYNFQTIPLSKIDIDLHYMLVQLVDEVFPQFASHGKKVTIHAADDLTVYGDPDKLARAFHNILKNAISYGEGNSVIDIVAGEEDSAVLIEFRNVGSVPEDQLHIIFDKFYRLDEARSSNTGGAGLGLAIAKEIVALHGGDIKAENESGHIVFSIKLPV